MSQEDELDREQEESLVRLEQGRIPVNAQRRLERFAREGGTFTSDLSVPGFALGHQLGLRPLTQVMGSCVYQVGWQYAHEAMYSYGRAVFQELEVITQAWNEARGRSLARMSEEARLAGADVVVGVQLRNGRYDWAADTVELAAFGTAARDPSAVPKGEAILTDLSVQDYWKLRQAGVQPCGFAATSACFFVVRGAWSAQMQMLTFNRNQEITDYTEGVYQARETALARLTDQVRAAGSDGVVGVNIAHSITEDELKVGMGSSPVKGLLVTFHVTGTAVRLEDRASLYPPETTIPLST